jgi:hypothetical protein
VDPTSTSTAECAGPDELCGHVSQFRVGSLGGMNEHGERLAFYDFVPLNHFARSIRERDPNYSADLVERH